MDLKIKTGTQENRMDLKIKTGTQENRMDLKIKWIPAIQDTVQRNGGPREANGYSDEADLRHNPRGYRGRGTYGTGPEWRGTSGELQAKNLFLNKSEEPRAGLGCLGPLSSVSRCIGSAS